jgi:uncharacterized protein
MPVHGHSWQCEARRQTANMTEVEPPEERSGILYVDTSALVKLLVREDESEAIELELRSWPHLAMSIVTKIELPRTVERVQSERPDAVTDGNLTLHGIMESASIVPLDDEVVMAARAVQPVTVAALDAIHVASALSLGKELAGVATYDRRMTEALKHEKVKVIAPGT